MQTLSTGYQLPKDKEILNCWIWRFDECIIIFFLTYVKSKIYLCGRGYSQVPAVPNSLKNSSPKYENMREKGNKNI